MTVSLIPADRVATAHRLGVPWYAYDTVTFTGEVTAVDDGVITVAVTGTNSLGKHVISTVTLTIGAAEPAAVGSGSEHRGPAGRGEEL